MYNVQCKLYSVQCTMYAVQCTMYTVQYTVYGNIPQRVFLTPTHDIQTKLNAAFAKTYIGYLALF